MEVEEEEEEEEVEEAEEAEEEENAPFVTEAEGYQLHPSSRHASVHTNTHVHYQHPLYKLSTPMCTPIPMHSTNTQLRPSSSHAPGYLN